MRQGSGSRNKGASGEREVVRILRDWWEPVEPGVTWMRSGELGRAPRQFREAGDVMCTAVSWPFTVEIKRVESYSREWFLTPGKASPVWGWWAQACGQADAESAEPMLWFRASREPWTVVLRTEFASALALPPPVRLYSYREAAPMDSAVAWPWPVLERIDPRVFAERA